MFKDKLIELISFWQTVSGEKSLYPREITNKIDRQTKEIVDIIGPRRTGKSSVLKLLMAQAGDTGKSMYINFEDPFFINNNSPEVIEELINVYEANFSSELKFLFFDEIQNISHWEKAIRKFRDSDKYKIFITGSSAKLLSHELASLLTGRHLSYLIYPLSFREYLLFNGIANWLEIDLISEKEIFKKHFLEYLSIGGFPEVVKTGQREFLKQYFNDILVKDILARYEVRDYEVLKNIGAFLATNSGKPLSINSLSKTYDISREAVNLYLGYFEEALLFLSLPLFSYSLHSQQRNPCKFYAVDTGIANAVSFRFSGDYGRQLENLVFVELKRRGQEIYYYKKQNYEIDFLTRVGGETTELIQVAWSLDDVDTKKREVKHLIEALSEFSKVKATILTFDTNEEIVINNQKIVVKPVWRWMLESGETVSNNH
jgi:hypothetical protein